MELNGKAPPVDASANWTSPSIPERHRTSERHRHRRRARVHSLVRARIRRNVWLACTGALLVMALGIYFVLGRQAGG